MAFPTPSTAPREQGVSLLFTPLSKAADGQKGATPVDFRSFSGLGRTPASAGRGFGGAGTAGPTPPSRRRSLTPASSRQMDTPPPPPMDSLLDSPGGLGAGAAPWGQGPDGVEDMQVSTSPYAAARAAAPAAAAGRDLARAAHALEQYEDTWVTVFGFGPSDLPLIIREFSKAGDIAQFGTFGEAASVNWIHIQYQNKHAAQRALLHNGEQLSATCMVGVKPLDASHRAAVERQAGGGAGAGGASFAMAFPKLQQQRPYTLEAASGAGAVVPLASKGLAQRVREFVLGC